MYFIETLEKSLSKATARTLAAEKEFLPMQFGDVPRTYASTVELERDFDYKLGMSIEDGLMKFDEWFKEYYHQGNMKHKND